MTNTNVKYAILSGGNSIGLIWESNGQEVIVFDKEVKIDLNFGFEIRDVETGNVIAEKMWLDVITGALQKGKQEHQSSDEMVTQDIVINLTVNNKEDLNTFASEIIKNLKKQRGLK